MHEFIKFLPLMRCYARALSGSQIRGDDLVVKVLEHLGRSPPPHSRYGPKVGLYKLFMSYWNRSNGSISQLDALFNHDELSTRALTSRICSVGRQAFLLVALEGFSYEEAAYILDINLLRFNQIIVLGREEISAQASANILIIEDEFFIATDLENMIREFGYTVTAVARTHSEALASLGRSVPELVITELTLGDGSNVIDTVKQIQDIIAVPVVFITSSSKDVLSDKELDQIFVISKPFGSDEVRAVVSQALFVCGDIV